MEKLKTYLRQILYRMKHDWFHYENILLIVCFVLCLGWTYGSIEAMSRNWTLSEILSEKEHELAVLEIEVETAQLENQYYSSEEYAELSARAKLNKKLPGETLIYLPENSEYAKEKHRKTTEKVEKERSNLSEWLTFLFGI